MGRALARRRHRRLPELERAGLVSKGEPPASGPRLKGISLYLIVVDGRVPGARTGLP